MSIEPDIPDFPFEPEELPPWMSLPPEVRERVCVRMKQLGREEIDREQAVNDLRELAAFRLINAIGLKKAMKLGQPYPGYQSKKEWLEASENCRKRIEQFRHDPQWREQAAQVMAAVIEELEAFKKRAMNQ